MCFSREIQALGARFDCREIGRHCEHVETLEIFYTFLYITMKLSKRVSRRRLKKQSISRKRKMNSVRAKRCGGGRCMIAVTITGLYLNHGSQKTMDAYLKGKQENCSNFYTTFYELYKNEEFQKNYSKLYNMMTVFKTNDKYTFLFKGRPEEETNNVETDQIPEATVTLKYNNLPDPSELSKKILKERYNSIIPWIEKNVYNDSNYYFNYEEFMIIIKNFERGIKVQNGFENDFIINHYYCFYLLNKYGKLLSNDKYSNVEINEDQIELIRNLIDRKMRELSETHSAV